MLHPASRIVLYLMAALAIPGLPFFMLIVFAVSALFILLAMRRSPHVLIWRMRWLLGILVLGYAYNLPGEALLASAGEWSPSREGLTHGAGQAFRLLIMLAWLDILVLSLAGESLLTGLYALARPLARIGLFPDRLALRLGLTLRAIERLERGTGNLRRLSEAPPDPGLPTSIRLVDHRAGVVDTLVLGTALLAVLLLFAGSWPNA